MFVDRTDAGRQLGERLAHLRDENLVILGLPRGGVVVAAEVALALGAALDVIVVRKLGVPSQPELAMGALGEGGVRILVSQTVHRAGVSKDVLNAVVKQEQTELIRRGDLFRGRRARIPLVGRTAVIVDDGIATGSTARAACQVAHAQGAGRVVLAVPVAPPNWTRIFRDVADELVCLLTPRRFHAIGRWYADFSQTTDEEVIAALHRAGADCFD